MLPDGLGSLRKIHAALTQSMIKVAFHMNSKLTKINGKNSLCSAGGTVQVTDASSLCMFVTAILACASEPTSWISERIRYLDKMQFTNQKFAQHLMKTQFCNPESISSKFPDVSTIAERGSHGRAVSSSKALCYAGDSVCITVYMPQIWRKSADTL